MSANIVILICIMATVTTCVLNVHCYSRTERSDEAEDDLPLLRPQQKLFWPWILLPGIYLPGSGSTSTSGGTGQPGEITPDPTAVNTGQTSTRGSTLGPIFAGESTEGSTTVSESSVAPIIPGESTTDPIITGGSTVNPIPASDPTTDSSLAEVESTTTE